MRQLCENVEESKTLSTQHLLTCKSIAKQNFSTRAKGENSTDKQEAQVSENRTFPFYTEGVNNHLSSRAQRGHEVFLFGTFVVCGMSVFHEFVIKVS